MFAFAVLYVLWVGCWQGWEKRVANRTWDVSKSSEQHDLPSGTDCGESSGVEHSLKHALILRGSLSPYFSQLRDAHGVPFLKLPE